MRQVRLRFQLLRVWAMKDATPIWIGAGAVVGLWLLSRSGSLNLNGVTAQQLALQQQQANLAARQQAVNNQAQSGFGSLLGGLIKGLSNPQKAQQPSGGGKGSSASSPSGGGGGGGTGSSKGSPCPCQDPATENVIQVCPCGQNPSQTLNLGANEPCVSPACPGTGVIGAVPCITGTQPGICLDALAAAPSGAPNFCPGPGVTSPCGNMPCPCAGVGGLGCPVNFAECV